VTLLADVEAFVAARPYEFGRVTGIVALQDTRLVKLARPTFVVHCRSAGVAQTRKRCRNFTLLVQNGHFIEYYWLIFLINHVMTAPDHAQASMPDPHAFAAVTAKRFAALRMLADRESDIACTLFLESLIGGIESHRAMRAFLARTPDLAALQDTVLRIAGEFIMFHEVAHELAGLEGLREQLDPFVEQQVAAAKPELRGILRHELFPDLVALHVVASKYSHIVREHSLRTFCRVIAAATCVINCWHLTAPELERANTGDAWTEPSLNLLLQACVRRYMICIAYIDTRLFRPALGIVCAADGIDYNVPLFEKLPDRLVNDSLVVDPLSQESRAVAETLAGPIRAHGALPSIIARAERTRALDKDPVVEEALRVRLQGLADAGTANDRLS
jgi:hypothetical protein